MESAVDRSGDEMSVRPVIALATITVALFAAAPASDGADGSTPGNLCSEVDLAPVRDSDRNPDGSRIVQRPDARGKYVPIVMVHGWTGSSTHGPDGAFSHTIDMTALPGQTFKARASLIGQLQRIRGAAVYTFDYHRDSAKWVTNDNLGPRMGRAIDCLFAKTGEKVILIAHSLGGLVSRYAAAQPSPTSPDRSDEISRIITFGTPETGSDLANTVAAGIDTATVTSASHGDLVTPMARLMLSYCGAQTTKAVETGGPCDFLPTVVRAFDTEAGRALQTDSRELRNLKPVPDSIPLNALAGDARISGTEGWFGSPRVGEYHAGDLIVPLASATSGATTVRSVTCRYQLDVSHWGIDKLEVSIGQKSQLDVAGSPLGAFAGACYHSNLMQVVQLTTEVQGLVSEDLGARAPDAGSEGAQGSGPGPARLPTCRDWVAMSPGDREQAVRTLQEAHGDHSSPTIAKFSVRVFCELNPGRRIDGVYAPGSRSPSGDGGTGSIPTCVEWREMSDEDADAALLRAARGHKHHDVSTLRLLTAGYCEFKRDAQIDGIYGGG
mgnify:CR=1 FL=1